MAKVRPNFLSSLTARVIALSSLWALAAFLVVGGVISSFYQSTAEAGFQAVVRAQLFNLINTVAVDEAGRLTGSPDLGDLSYSQPLSGWYWEVLPAADNTSGHLMSFSLGPGEIASPTTAEVPFDGQYRRAYETDGLDGEVVYVEEAEVVLDADNHVARFRVMGNADIIRSDIARFNENLSLYLGAFAAGSILINALAILYGLAPLRRVRRALGEVRAGRSETLAGQFPLEIQPLAIELNAMIDNNRRIVERARTQVGNLAHSLKTPIAVMINEADAIGGERGRVVAEQSERMRVQVQHYLDRARVAALSEGAIARTPVKTSLERLVKVIRRLNPQISLKVNWQTSTELVFAGEKEDFEEVLGNLLENAAKWAHSHINITIAELGDDAFQVLIDDDGPGLGEDEIAQATKRGRRLDEAKPGSGLGLSIVADTITQYRGQFNLSRAPIGGLRAEVLLPTASAVDTEPF
ncbi:histidine kinase [Aureimonas fodinaquatilis]|uniref:histidine kinase n=1 Tax=Aureimonas fodinaquatilis TaxID=2565783 RepID=A0A5B0DXH7_9HYPH|nr:ATP-binding protein [Aureimonas fodinaquatilis]KAA0971058.1 histidine kinase [Aureimonas fodinaquatilis]